MAYITNGINTVYFSVVEEENYDLSASITSQPVESGIDVADHVKISPRSYSISGLIVGSDAESRKNALIKIFSDRKMCVYVGRSKASDAIIESLSYGYSAGVGNGFKFDLSYREVRISVKQTVTLSYVALPPIPAKDSSTAVAKAETKTSPASSSGKQSTKTTSSSSDFNLKAEVEKRKSK